MRFGELKRELRRRGYPFVRGFITHDHNYARIFGVGEMGSGDKRDYGEREIRRWVIYRQYRKIMGSDIGPSGFSYIYDILDLVDDHDHGWLYWCTSDSGPEMGWAATWAEVEDRVIGAVEGGWGAWATETPPSPPRAGQPRQLDSYPLSPFDAETQEVNL